LYLVRNDSECSTQLHLGYKLWCPKKRGTQCKFLLQQALIAGIGSEQLTYTHGLLVTVAKVCARLLQDPRGFSDLSLEVAGFVDITAITAQSVLVSLVEAENAAGEAGDDSRGRDAVTAMLPWLSLQGRLFQCMATLLQLLQAKLKRDAQAGRLKSAIARAQTLSTAVDGSNAFMDACAALLPSTHAQSTNRLTAVLTAVGVGNIGGVAHRAQIAGQGVKVLLDSDTASIADRTAAQRNRNRNSSSSSSSSRASATADVVPVRSVVSSCEEADVRGYIAALHEVDAALGRVPNNLSCNNPGCTSLKLSEMRLVDGHTKSKCAGCLLVYYCSVQCQAAHWQSHKPVCKAVQARQRRTV
jgi:hypothetical protein